MSVLNKTHRQTQLKRKKTRTQFHKSWVILQKRWSNVLNWWQQLEQQLLQQQCSRQLIPSVCQIIIILISTRVAGSLQVFPTNLALDLNSFCRDQTWCRGDATHKKSVVVVVTVLCSKCTSYTSDGEYRLFCANGWVIYMYMNEWISTSHINVFNLWRSWSARYVWTTKELQVNSCRWRWWAAGCARVFDKFVQWKKEVNLSLANFVDY